MMRNVTPAPAALMYIDRKSSNELTSSGQIGTRGIARSVFWRALSIEPLLGTYATKNNMVRYASDAPVVAYSRRSYSSNAICVVYSL